MLPVICSKFVDKEPPNYFGLANKSLKQTAGATLKSNVGSIPRYLAQSRRQALI
jgi:hypothetical protein